MRVPVAALLLCLSTALCAAEPGPYGQVTGGGNYTHDQDFGTTGGTLDFNSGGVGSASLGYRFGNGWRPEVEYAYRQNDVNPDNGLGANGTEKANTGMANLWYDFSAGGTGRLHPYLGAGAGTTNVQLDQVTDSSGFTRDGSDNVFAYQAGAGLGYDVTQRLALTLGYRYLETAKAHFDGAAGTPGTALSPGTPDVAAVDTRYRSDGVLAGLRYVFGRSRSAPMAAAEPEQQVATAAPAAPQPEPAEEAAFETIVLRPVNFQFDKAELTEPSKGTLDELAAKLAAHPEMSATIEGYTDAIGSADYNKQLGRKRAEAVRDYLAGKGVDAGHIQVASRGKDDPVADNSTEEGRAQNRRAEVKAADSAQNVKIEIQPATEESVDAAKQK